jgi:signal transduction histidine kinase
MIRLLAAQLEDRRNIAHYLHDTVSQDLVLLNIALNMLRRDAALAAAPGFSRALEMASRCNSSLRALSYVLSPPALEDLSTEAALEWYVQHLREDAGIDVWFECEGEWVPHERSHLLFLTAVQRWAEIALRQKPAARTTIRLTAGPCEIGLEFLCLDDADLSIAAVTSSVQIVASLRALSGTMLPIQGYSGASIRLSVSTAANPQPDRPAEELHGPNE